MERSSPSNDDSVDVGVHVNAGIQGKAINRTASYVSISDEILNLDEFELSYRLSHGSDDIRMQTIDNLVLILRRNVGRFPYKDPLIVFHGFDALLAVDVDPKIRHKALQLICDMIPFFGEKIDQCMSTIMLRLISNFGDKRNGNIRRAVVLTLHQYLKHSQDRERLLLDISNMGLGSSDPDIRREILLSTPLLFTKELAKENFYDIVLSIGKLLRNAPEDHHLKQVAHLALRTIQDLVGLNAFQECLKKLPSKLLQDYRQSVEHKNENRKVQKVKTPEDPTSHRLSELLPPHLMESINQKEDWRRRVRGIEKLKLIIVSLPDQAPDDDPRNILLPYISFFYELLDDTNFQIIIATLEAMLVLIDKFGRSLLPYLNPVVLAFSKIVHDQRNPVRQIVMRMVMKLMYHCHCQPVVEALTVNMNCRDSTTRKEAINFTMAGLLTYQEDEFDLEYISSFLAPALDAEESEVRQAAMECVTLLTSMNGERFLSSLQRAVEAVEGNLIYDLLKMAIDTRLQWNKRPVLRSNGLVDYASSHATVFSYGKHSSHESSADIDWIVDPSDELLAMIAEDPTKTANLDFNSHNRYRNETEETGRIMPEKAEIIPSEMETEQAQTEVKNEGEQKLPRMDKKQGKKQVTWDETTLDTQSKDVNTRDGEKERLNSGKEMAFGEKEEARMKQSDHGTNLEKEDFKKDEVKEDLHKQPSLQEKQYLDQDREKERLNPGKETAFGEKEEARREQSDHGKNLEKKDIKKDEVTEDLHKQPSLQERQYLDDKFDGDKNGEGEKKEEKEEQGESSRLDSKTENALKTSEDFGDKNSPSEDNSQATKTDKQAAVKKPVSFIVSWDDCAPGEGVTTLEKKATRPRKVSFDIPRKAQLQQQAPDPDEQPVRAKKPAAFFVSWDAPEVPHDITTCKPEERKSPAVSKIPSESKRKANPTKPFSDPNVQRTTTKKAVTFTVDWDAPLQEEEEEEEEEEQEEEEEEQEQEQEHASVDPEEPEQTPPVYSPAETPRKSQPRKPVPDFSKQESHPEEVQPTSSWKDPEESPVTQKKNNPIKNAMAYLEKINLNMASLDWEKNMEGLRMIQELAEHRPDFCCGQELHKLFTLVTDQVQNLRSKLSGLAVNILGNLFMIRPKEMEKEVETGLMTLLEKSAECKSFLREAIEAAIFDICIAIPAARVVPVLGSKGATHKNPVARALASKSLELISEETGFDGLLTGKGNLSAHFIPAVCRLALDSTENARSPARNILRTMVTEPDLDEILEQTLDSRTLRDIQGIIAKMKKGTSREMAPHPSRIFRPPPVRKQQSQSSQQRKQDASKLNCRGSQAGKKMDQQSNETSRKPALPAADAAKEMIEDLGSKDWEVCVAAMDCLRDLTLSHPDLIGNLILRVFDKFASCLHDIRGKVNIKALEVMLVIIEPLKDYLPKVINMVVINVAPNLNSKNPEFSALADRIMMELKEHLDPAILVQPFGREALQANTRSKHLLVDYMASIVVLLCDTKPKLIMLNILPVLWQVLDIPGPSAALKRATSNLVHNLDALMGKDLVDKTAHSQGSNDRRLRALKNYLNEL